MIAIYIILSIIGLICFIFVFKRSWDIGNKKGIYIEQNSRWFLGKPNEEIKRGKKDEQQEND